MSKAINPKPTNPDITRWNSKYDQAVGARTEKIIPQGEPELIAHKSLLGNRGLALEAACGPGANALYLATLGYEVIASDFAVSGIKLCQSANDALKLPVSLLVCDLENHPFADNSFELVSVVRFLQRDLFGELKSWIAPGGLIFYKTFNTEHLAIKPHFNPHYVVEIGELNDYFSDFDILVSNLKNPNASTTTAKGTSYIIARKPF